MKDEYRTQIRMPMTLGDWIKSQSEEQGRSINSQMVHLLKRAMQNAQKPSSQ